MAQFERAPQKFLLRGLKLNAPVGLMPPGKYPILKNIRTYQDGTIETRPGTSAISTALTGSVHKIRILNDSVPSASSAWTYLAGAGVNLYSGQGPFTLRDTGYSGAPLSMIPHRPDQTPEPWMYIGDNSRMSKINVAGTRYNWGIAPPAQAPVTVLATPSYKVISDFDVTTTWVNAGTAGAITAPARVTTTISSILYDRTPTGGASTTGWALIQPVLLDNNIQAGIRLRVNSGGGTDEQVRVEDVYNPISATTVGSISYDTGSTGFCTIQLATPSPGLVRDSMQELSTGNAAVEKVRVLSVTYSPDQIPSFRCYAANTHIAGRTVTGVRAIRAYCANNHAAAETLGTNCLTSTIATGLGYMDLPGALDLSFIGSRPLSQEDEIHISIKIANLSLFTEGRVYLDVDAATAAALPALSVTAFTQNAYYYPFRANDLTPAVQSSTSQLSADQRAVQRAAIDRATRVAARQSVRGYEMGGAYYIPSLPPVDEFTGMLPEDQTATGDSQWSELVFKVKDLIRVGTDSSRELKDVSAIRVYFSVTGSVDCFADAWWVGGSYGPDDSGSDEFPYFYTYRGRSSVTGAKSNPAPPTRSGLSSSREGIVIYPPQHPDAQVDKLDLYRFGGSLNEWHLLATIDNGATPSYTDNLPDEAIVAEPLLEFDNFQPFPQIDLPRTGTCDVIGTEVTRTAGDTFNVAWAPGSIIFINGTAQVLYARPTSTSRLSLQENAGTLSAVSFYLPEPTLLGQTLPVMWGPFGGGEGGVFMFGCGSSLQPGTLFWTKGNDPDSAPDTNSLEITNPSEPLMGGCIYDGLCYVLSSERMFKVIPVGETFIAQPVAHSVGLANRWGICVGEHIFFLGKDGIYKSDGGECINLTDEDLYPLFPHDGQIANNTFSTPAPDFTGLTTLQLNVHNGLLYFDYFGLDATFHTLIFDTRINGWLYDSYQLQVRTHYGAEGAGRNQLVMGADNGQISTLSATTDSGAAIQCQVRTGALEIGDNRIRKAIGDVSLDMSNGVSVTATIGFDEYSLTATPTVVPAGSRATTVLDFSPLGVPQQKARNVQLDLIWSGAGVQLFEWQPSFIYKTEVAKLRATDWDDAQYEGAKFVQGLVLELDTLGDSKSFQIQYDGGTVGATITVAANGQIEVPFSWTPFIAHSMRIFPLDSEEWECYNARWVWEPAPELTTSWITQGTTHDLQGFQHLDRTSYIALQSTSTVSFTINVDGVDHGFSIPSTAGSYRKLLVPLSVIKGKLFTYSLTSTAGFRLYQRDCEVRVKSWADGGPYRPMNPFGDIHRLNGARI